MTRTVAPKKRTKRSPQRPPLGADDTSYKSNIFWCVVYGLGGGAVFTVWVTILFALRGTEPFDKQGVTFASVVLFYLLGGATGGLIAGALWPLTRSRAGAYLVGILVAFVVAAGLMFLLAGSPLRWDMAAILTILTMTLIYGLYIGYHIWKYVQDG